MIIIKLKGGLGNQLFQYAFGFEMSKLIKRELYLDMSELECKNKVDTPRDYELYPYPISAKKLTKDELKKLNLINSSLLKKLIVKTGIEYNKVKYYNETHFDSISISGNCKIIVFDGYWQKEKYFSGIQHELKNQILAHSLINNYSIDISKQILDCESVSVHIRRGDYISNPNAAKFHALCGVSYYESAMELISRKLTSAHFFVFTDDPEWAKINISSRFQFTIVSGKFGISHHDELSLMAKCGNNIISNSSFSWWGAWSNKNKNKIIIAPKIWHKNSDGEEIKGLIPDDWILI